MPSAIVPTIVRAPAADTTPFADFGNRQIAILFVVLTGITSIPIVLYPWLPLADYINHLARMYVIAGLGTDSDLARFYEIDWQLIPNLMMDLHGAAIAAAGERLRRRATLHCDQLRHDLVGRRSPLTGNSSDGGRCCR